MSVLYNGTRLQSKEDNRTQCESPGCVSGIQSVLSHSSLLKRHVSYREFSRKLQQDRADVQAIGLQFLRENRNVIQIHCNILIEDIPEDVAERLQERHSLLMLIRLLQLGEATGPFNVIK